MATEARIRANTKYEKKAYERLYIRFRKDDPELTIEQLQTAADAAGQSVNAYVMQAIKERMYK